MASNNYTAGLLEIQKQNIDYVNDTIQALLVTNTFTFDKSHQFVSQITGEVSGTGYSRATLGTKSIDSTTGTPDTINFKAANLTWAGIDVSPDDLYSLVVFKFVTNDADSLLIANVDFPNISTNGNNITVEFPSSVVFKATNPIV